MRLGFVLPAAGETTRSEAVATIAQHAEHLGYDSLWVTERELFPVRAWPACNPFGGSSRESLDAAECLIDSLAVAATATERIAVGISIPNIPFYSPVMVAHGLAMLDALSGGRARLGLGLGWSADDFRTVASALQRPDTPASEFLRMVKAIWSGDGDQLASEHYFVPRSALGPRPVQRPHPPIYLTAFTPAAVQRSAVLVSGKSVLTPRIAATGQTTDALRLIARASNQGSDNLELVIRADVQMTEDPVGPRRSLCTGSMDQIREDVMGAYELGAAEIVFDLSSTPEARRLDHTLAHMTQIREIVPEFTRTAPPAPQLTDLAAQLVA